MKNMKKVIAVGMGMLLTASVAGCGSASSSSSVSTTELTSSGETAEAASSGKEIIVFAAASMTETMNEIKTMYEKANPGVTVTCNYDSSGTLQEQIQQGADCDIFISAGQKQMDALDATKDKEANPDGSDFVEQGTRVDLLENKVVLAVPKDNAKGIKSFEDMAQKLKDGSILLAMGNSDVPVGQYTQKILKYFKLDEAALAKAGSITYGSNVKEVTTQVSEGSVDCGVVYATDAYSAKLTTVDTATKEMCGQVIYPAAVMKNAKNKDGAEKLLDYLKTDEAMKVFESVGFSSAK